MKISTTDRVRVWMAGVATSVLIGAASPAPASIWYVWETAPGGDNGLSWFHAFHELYDALGAASEGDQIWVAEGTYKPSSSTPRVRSFILQHNVDLYGGLPPFAGSLDEQDVDTYETILSGDHGDNDDVLIYSDNAYTVLRAIDVGHVAVDGFTIQCGVSDGTGQPHQAGGGAIYVENCDFVLRDCSVTGNFGMNGGAVYVAGDSHLMAKRCDFYENHASVGGGGAIFIEPELGNNAVPRATLERCRFHGNTAILGGAIDNRSRLGAYSCLFSGNMAASDGGAIHVVDAAQIMPRLRLVNVTVVYNDAGGYGGGLCTIGSLYDEVYNSVFWGNTASLTPDWPHVQISPLNMCGVEYCCIQDLDLLTDYGSCWWGDPGYANIGGDPEFKDPEGDNGSIGDLDDDFSIPRTSCCVDSGEKAHYPYDYPLFFDYDLAGNDRVVRGSPFGPWWWRPEIDIGAYEAQPLMLDFDEFKYIDLGG